MDFHVRPQSLSTRDSVYMQLREQILKLELPPGTALSENETSLLFKVSRTPVRESFLRLAQEGLVQVLPQRGTLVSLIDTVLVEEARFMREHLERAVIRLACVQFPKPFLLELQNNLRLQQECVHNKDNQSMFALDEAFHRILFVGCSKSNTWSNMQQMNGHLNRSRMLRLVDDHHWENLYEQHRLMAEAVEAQDAETADRLMTEHLTQNISDQALLKEKYPHYYK
jgi:DNA-binding GntR family transcriptional regulator